MSLLKNYNVCKYSTEYDVLEIEVIEIIGLIVWKVGLPDKNEVGNETNVQDKVKENVLRKAAVVLQNDEKVEDGLVVVDENEGRTKDETIRNSWHLFIDVPTN